MNRRICQYNKVLDMRVLAAYPIEVCTTRDASIVDASMAYLWRICELVVQSSQADDDSGAFEQAKDQDPSHDGDGKTS